MHSQKIQENGGIFPLKNYLLQIFLFIEAIFDRETVAKRANVDVSQKICIFFLNRGGFLNFFLEYFICFGKAGLPLGGGNFWHFRYLVFMSDI